MKWYEYLLAPLGIIALPFMLLFGLLVCIWTGILTFWEICKFWLGKNKW